MKLALEAVGRIGKERGTPQPAVTSPPRPHRALGCPTLTAALVFVRVRASLCPQFWEGSFLQTLVSPCHPHSGWGGPQKVGLLGAGQSTQL